MSERHFRTCNLCEAMCGMVITVDQNRVTDIRGDDEDPFSRGHICPKGPAMREIQEDPDRLRRPQKRRSDGTYETISWEQAFTEVAAKITALQAQHGRDAMAIYAGNPSVHNHGTVLVGQGFMKALGTKSRFDANSNDANPKLFSCMQMFGDPSAIPIPDIDRTDYMLMLGANPAASNGSLMSLGDVRGRFAELKKRGGHITLVDPRRTETSAWANEHHFIQPGADAPFLLAILHVLFDEKLVDEHAIAEKTNGVDELRAIAKDYPPARVAAVTGIAAETIQKIARDFAAAKRAVCYGRVGTCLNEFGSVASWLIDCINVVTGNFDREGGVMFPEPAVDVGSISRKLGFARYGRWRSRVRGYPEFSGQLPSAAMAEEMETPGPGQIRGLFTIAGNPVLSSPNGERLSAALAKLDLVVSLDFYVNETSRHAHYILPPTFALERSHYDLVFHVLAVRNGAKFGKRVITPEADTREDWEILYELAMRIGGLKVAGKLVDGGLKLAWRAGWRLAPDRLLDILLRTGKYKLSLKKLLAQPHGVDLGPLRPCWKAKVCTKSKKVELAPSILTADLPRVARWIDERAASAGGLVLIGRRHVRSNNSWMHNVRSLTKGPDRSGLLMHPDDATRLGLTDGATVAVTSRVGSVQAKLSFTSDIMHGVVSLPHGFGHAAAKDTLKIAGALAGASLNALTDDVRVEPLSGTSILNGVPVTVMAT